MKKKWTIGKTRSVLYLGGKILGDINAVKRGKIGQRVVNRVIGNPSARISQKLSKSIVNIFKKK